MNQVVSLLVAKNQREDNSVAQTLTTQQSKSGFVRVVNKVSRQYCDFHYGDNSGLSMRLTLLDLVKES